MGLGTEPTMVSSSASMLSRWSVGHARLGPPGPPRREHRLVLELLVRRPQVAHEVEHLRLHVRHPAAAAPAARQHHARTQRAESDAEQAVSDGGRPPVGAGG